MLVNPASYIQDRLDKNLYYEFSAHIGAYPVCVCMCIPILEWLSAVRNHCHTNPAPCVRPRCVCNVLRHHRPSVTMQSPTATLIPLFSSSELTGRGYPGLLDRKNHSDMCPRWESNPRLPACKASTLSTRPDSPLGAHPT